VYNKENQTTMGRQISSFPITGAVGNLIFYTSKYGNQVRRKGSLNKQRIRTDPRFEKTRENLAEFSRNAKYGKLIRYAFKNLLRYAQDGDTVTRMSSILFKIIKSDVTSPRGERQLQFGDISLLNGFEFNKSVKVSEIINANFSTSVDRGRGVASITIQSFIPIHNINAPGEATHFMLRMGVAEFDFANLTKNDVEAVTRELPINEDITEEIVLSGKLPPGGGGVVLVALGVEFLVESEKGFEVLKPAALAVVGVSGF
jgi:hypothetical protein